MQSETRRIIKLLANGFDPITGAHLPSVSPYNHPQVIRALFNALNEMDLAEHAVVQKPLPANHGKPWTETDKEQLALSFKQGQLIKEIATRFQRTVGSIRSELIRQGLITLADEIAEE